MKRGYTEIGQERFKSLLGEYLPEDARIYAFELVPNTGSVRIYFYSDFGPDVPDDVSAPFWYAGEGASAGRRRR